MLKAEGKRLFLEWILQNKDGHLMMFTQRSTCILNRDSTDEDRNKAENWIELHWGSEHPFWGFSTDLRYLAQSTDLKTVSRHL